jgi:hypothetical protein
MISSRCPTPEGEGAESPAEDGIGVDVEGVERGKHAGQLATKIVPGQGKSRSIQRFQKIF